MFYVFINVISHLLTRQLTVLKIMVIRCIVYQAEGSIFLPHLPVPALLLPAMWLVPIKHPLQAAQLPNTFKSHKIQQLTILSYAKTLIQSLHQGHAENSNGDKVVLDAVWWMNVKKLQITYVSNAGVKETPQGMEVELGSPPGLGSKQFDLMMRVDATAREQFKEHLSVET